MNPEEPKIQTGTKGFEDPLFTKTTTTTPKTTTIDKSKITQKPAPPTPTKPGR